MEHRHRGDEGEADRRRSIGAVISPHLTIEEAYLLIKYVRSIDPAAVLALGPVPVVHDERFPNGFTIHATVAASRCCSLNIERQGLELRRFPKGARCEDAPHFWVSAGYKKTDWNDDTTARKFAGLDLLVVQDLLASPLWNMATYFPGGSFAEREGSYVNFQDQLLDEFAVRRLERGSKGNSTGVCLSGRGSTKAARCSRKPPPKFYRSTWRSEDAADGPRSPAQTKSPVRRKPQPFNPSAIQVCRIQNNSSKFRNARYFHRSPD